MESIFMKSKFVRNPFARKFVAKALGASMATGLAFAAVAPAQADTYSTYPTLEGGISYTFISASGAQTEFTVFTIEAKTATRGWFKGAGWTGQWPAEQSNGMLQGLRVTQVNPRLGLCMRVSKPGVGWSQEKCTNGMNSMIEVGDGTTKPIEAIIVRLSNCQERDLLIANPYLTFAEASYNKPAQGTWQENFWDTGEYYSNCGGPLRMGVQGGNGLPRIDAIYLSISGFSSPFPGLPVK
jgi:hypothetical protein